VDDLCHALAEDAGGLASDKDDNMAWRKSDRKDGAIFKFGDYKSRMQKRHANPHVSFLSRLTAASAPAAKATAASASTATVKRLYGNKPSVITTATKKDDDKYDNPQTTVIAKSEHSKAPPFDIVLQDM